MSNLPLKLRGVVEIEVFGYYTLGMSELVDYLLLRDVGPLVTGGWKVLYKSRILGERN
jgi:hypothetical protein